MGHPSQADRSKRMPPRSAPIALCPPRALTSTRSCVSRSQCSMQARLTSRVGCHAYPVAVLLHSHISRRLWWGGWVAGVFENKHGLPCCCSATVPLLPARRQPSPTWSRLAAWPLMPRAPIVGSAAEEDSQKLAACKKGGPGEGVSVRQMVQSLDGQIAAACSTT